MCAELSYKTPAQVLQEYQNRNRGISINYNTHSVDQDGAKLFKTIVSAGNTAAEVAMRCAVCALLPSGLLTKSLPGLSGEGDRVD